MNHSFAHLESHEAYSDHDEHEQPGQPGRPSRPDPFSGGSKSEAIAGCRSSGAAVNASACNIGRWRVWLDLHASHSFGPARTWHGLLKANSEWSRSLCRSGWYRGTPYHITWHHAPPRHAAARCGAGRNGTGQGRTGREGSLKFETLSLRAKCYLHKVHAKSVCYGVYLFGAPPWPP